MENFLGLWVLGRVIRNKRRLLVLAPSMCDRHVVVICLTLITSKPRLTNLSEISSARVLRGRWQITAFTGFSDFGK
jgi:hypothetical protein